MEKVPAACAGEERSRASASGVNVNFIFQEPVLTNEQRTKASRILRIRAAGDAKKSLRQKKRGSCEPLRNGIASTLSGARVRAVRALAQILVGEQRAVVREHALADVGVDIVLDVEAGGRQSEERVVASAARASQLMGTSGHGHLTRIEADVRPASQETGCERDVGSQRGTQHRRGRAG